jgi:excinuclease ABC subunit C
VAATFSFDHRIEFLAGTSDAVFPTIPAAPGIFSLRGEGDAAQPYLSRTTDLRRRLRRLLAPPEALDEHGRPVLSKRLNLRDRVRLIEYTRTGSDFESNLVLYAALRSAFGADETRRRMRLHTPYMLRITMSQQHPRVYSTNRLSRRSMPESIGPFPSRVAADRYCDAVLDLFQLRRCWEDLEPYPDHPGCVYGEMNKCMQPCKQGNPEACTPEQYAREAERVFAFFTTHGQSLLDEIATQREAASEAMDFEAAATLHKQWEKARAASLLADELIGPIAALRAVVLQESSPAEMDSDRTADAAVFLLENGRIVGPERLSTLGVRAVREQTSVGSSLFAQPLMLAPVPLHDPQAELQGGGDPGTDSGGAGQPSGNARTEVAATPEDRARTTLAALTAQATPVSEIAELCDMLSLFRRWYSKPEKQRPGEVLLPNADGSWPIRRILNGAARVVLGPPAPVPDVDREAAKALKTELKTKIIHAGREGVEREVPVLPPRKRSRKSITPADLAE